MDLESHAPRPRKHRLEAFQNAWPFFSRKSREQFAFEALALVHSALARNFAAELSGGPSTGLPETPMLHPDPPLKEQHVVGC